MEGTQREKEGKITGDRASIGECAGERVLRIASWNRERERGEAKSEKRKGVKGKGLKGTLLQ